MPDIVIQIRKIGDINIKSLYLLFFDDKKLL